MSEECNTNDSIAQTHIEVREGKRKVKIAADNICYIEASNHKSLIRCVDDCYLEAVKISDLETVLSPDDFLRVHRSYIVNCNYIKNYAKRCIIMKNGEKVKVSPRKEPELLERIRVN